MIPAFLLAPAVRLVGERFAKPLIIGAAVVLVVLAAGVAKCRYDANLIKQDRLEQNAETLERKVDADSNASEQRRDDDATIARQEKELHDAVAKVPDSAPDAVRIKLGCERLRRAGQDISRFPACAGS